MTYLSSKLLISVLLVLIIVASVDAHSSRHRHRHSSSRHKYSSRRFPCRRGRRGCRGYKPNPKPGSDFCKTADCGPCAKCDSKKKECVPIKEGKSPDGCDGKSCNGGTPESQVCRAGKCVTEAASPCSDCNTCVDGECKFDSTSATANVCNCGSICTEQIDGSGACTEENACSSGQVCKEGETDEQDECLETTCTPACPSNNVCILGTCRPFRNCVEARREFCQTVFEALGREGDATCCRRSSGCTDTTLGLKDDTITCSTNCDAGCTTGGDEPEAFCKIGDVGNSNVAGFPVCSDLLADLAE